MTETAVAVESRPQPMTAGFAPKERQALNPNQQVAFAMINIVTFLVGLAVLAVLDPATSVSCSPPWRSPRSWRW